MRGHQYARDLELEFVATERHGKLEPERLARRFAELEQQAADRLAKDRVPESRWEFRWLADGRYKGQGYELRFDVPKTAEEPSWIDELEEAFHEAHEHEYGTRAELNVEVVNVRVLGIGRVEELVYPELEAGSSDPASALTVEADVVFDVEGRPGPLATPFYDREQLRAGDRIDGPAVIEQYDTTTVVPPGFSAAIDRFGNIVIDCAAAITAARWASDGLATPILMRVIGGALSSIGKEMASVLYRMSFSSIIRESEDLGAGIFDADGNLLAESDTTPLFMAAMGKAVRGALSVLGDDVHAGDVILHNDPYLGASHSPDVCVIVPIFLDGECVGFSAASAHLTDIGGAYPGLATDVVDIWAEGNIYRAVKLVSQGVRQEKLYRHILENTRTPTHNHGDIEAMIASAERARTRYLELLRRYGAETVLEAANGWIAYSERMLRQEIAKVPDGEYEAPVGWLDDDGRNRGVRLPIKVKVIIEGDELTVDLTGSSDEVPTGFNCPYEGSTVAFMNLITRMIFLDEATYPVYVPQNEGMFKPVNVIAPKGSIFNPNFPRATFTRGSQLQRTIDLVLKALAPVIPEKVTAGNSAHLHFMAYSGFDAEEGEYWVYLEANEGSYGGRTDRDGLDSIDSLIANTRNNPIEELEWRFPMRTERYELRDEPCAAGKWRGGIGVVRKNRFLVDTIVTCEGERHDSDLPWGSFGGQDGLNASTIVNPGEPDEVPWPSKFTGLPFDAGNVIQITVPSSGGFGDPLERDPELVLSDVLDGFTTLELAERDYGVVIDRGAMRVDGEATAALRSSRRE